jgi:CubicO group peptidase (beta-lactamase class C family)
MIERVSCVVLLSLLVGCSTAPPPSPVTEHMRTLAEQAVLADPGASLVLLLRVNQQTHVVGAGSPIAGSAPDGDTRFEIGSITKVFTAALLDIALQRGEVPKEATLGAVWPDPLGASDAAAIPLAQLASHTSGLPRLPANFKPALAADPYADYSQSLATAALLAWKRPPQPRFEYSNFGVGVLGWALANAAHTDYSSLVGERILQRLEMRATGTDLSELERIHLAQPRVAKRPFRTWSFGCLGAAGALKSSAHDLLRFLIAQESAQAPELARAFASMRDSWQSVGGTQHIDSGWFRAKVRGHNADLIWHNGGTAGSSSFCGFVPGQDLAVVVLVNCASHVVNVDELGSALVKLGLTQVGSSER